MNTSRLGYGGVLAQLNSRAASVLKLRDDGYQEASVEVALTKPDSEYLPVESLSLKTRYVLLGDSWNAAAPDKATESIRRMVPTSLLDNGAIRTVQSIVGFVFDDLDPRNFELGKVDVGVAPASAWRPMNAATPTPRTLARSHHETCSVRDDAVAHRFGDGR
ncbi:hypothetical protein ASALC70_02553 [Alcanivorax sp. ALC70]|nr:hypothetical protein ASALC70_02553 [Alcanivorax sp. ALC70]